MSSKEEIDFSDLPDEVWMPIPGFPGYDISIYCRFKSYWKNKSLGGNKRGRLVTLMDKPQHFLKPVSTKGRLQISLRKDGKGYTKQVGFWLLSAFICECPGIGWECCHKNSIPLDNNLDNLYWGTRTQNRIDTVYNGNHAITKLKPSDIPTIRQRLLNGDNQSDIAKDNNVTQGTISFINLGKTWKHVL